MEDLIIKIGEAAGATYKQLELGPSSLYILKAKLAGLGYDGNISLMAIGWLARENKLHIVNEGKTLSIKLK
jgi:hypothetical protein